MNPLESTSPDTVLIIAGWYPSDHANPFGNNLLLLLIHQLYARVVNSVPDTLTNVAVSSLLNVLPEISKSSVLVVLPL